MALRRALNTPSVRLAAILVLGLGAIAWAAWVQSRAGLPAGESPRPFWSIHPLFWLQAGVGLGAFSIAGWVWSLRPRDLASGLFALSGLATLTFTVSAAIANTRDTPLPPGLYAALNSANAIGASMFGIVVIALFLIYPLRLPRWRALALISTGVFGAWTALAVSGRIGMPWSNVHLITLVEMGGICAAMAGQWLVTRTDPAARAVVIWFGLSVLIGAGGFISSIAAPNVLGLETNFSAKYAFAFFLLIYIGLAAGLRRYRLFELGDWAFRVLFYMAAAALLIVLDAVLIALVSVEPASAFGISLLAVAFLYLPLRDALARRFLKRSRLSESELFHAVVDVAFGRSTKARAEQWKALLVRLFDPLECVLAEERVDEPQIGADGMELTLPRVADIPSFRLRYPWGGRALFAPRHLETARQLVTLMSHAEANRKAYDRGVAEERSRIARDMHDNIGAQLLAALHSGDDERKNSMIRETLTDLRDIINNAARPGLTFDETLADLRAETAERLSHAGVALDWSAEANDAPYIAPTTAHALRSIVREAVSNVIRHAGAGTVRIQITHADGTATLLIEDDGQGFDPAKTRSGNGLSNMQARATSLRGTFEFSNGAGGARLAARFPLGQQRGAE